MQTGGVFLTKNIACTHVNRVQRESILHSIESQNFETCYLFTVIKLNFCGFWSTNKPHFSSEKNSLLPSSTLFLINQHHSFHAKATPSHTLLTKALSYTWQPLNYSLKISTPPSRKSSRLSPVPKYHHRPSLNLLPLLQKTPKRTSHTSEAIMVSHLLLLLCNVHLFIVL